MLEWRSSPFLSPDPLAGRSRLLLRRRRLGSWERYDVSAPEEGALLLTATRYGRFWANLLAGLVGIAAGLSFAGVIGFKALSAQDDTAQAGLFLLAALGGVVLIFLVDILLSPARDVRGHIPGGDRRAYFRLIEAHKINLRASTFTLYDPERKARASMRKDYLGDLGRKRWTCRAPDGREVCSLVEDSALRSLLHRLLGGAFGLFATDYIFVREGSEIGRLRRRAPWRRTFLLELGPGLDPFLGVAMAVLADSIEWR